MGIRAPAKSPGETPFSIRCHPPCGAPDCGRQRTVNPEALDASAAAGEDRRMRWPSLVIGLAIAAVLVGCGGDGETTTVGNGTSQGTGASSAGETTAGSSSLAAKQRFVHEGDAICQDFNRRGDALNITAIDQLASHADETRALVSQGLDRLQQLEPPPTVELRWDQYLAAVKDQARALQEAATAAEQGDVATVQRQLAIAKDADKRKATVALDIGFAECGTG
jgi:hypothetical protein